MLRPALLLLVLVAAAALSSCKRGELGPPLRPMHAIPVTAGSAHNATSALGTNLTALSDYSTEWPFTDAFKTSRAWISSSEGTWDDKRPLDLDENGWPRSLAPGQWARTLLLWDVPIRAVPPGDYVVTWTGKGKVVVWPHAPASSEPNRIVFRMEGKETASTSIVIQETDPSDPVRDVRVWMPGFEGAKQLFHPAFLERIRMYKVLRFMDWMATNDSKVTSWSERPQLTHARWDRGAPVEVIVELANTLQADPWINVPHLADDAWVDAFATLLAEKVDKDRIVWVEHSNEVWNGQFAQAKHAAREGNRLGLARKDNEAQLKWHSQRSVRIFQAFERAFGGTQRIVRVMGSQAVNAWASEVLLEHEDAWKHTDALAIAPYFGGELGAPDQRARVSALSVDELMAELSGPALDRVKKSLAAQAKVAARFGTPLVAYEGGQHLAGVGPAQDDERINALFDQANRDPRMKDVYAAYLKAWKDAGGRTFVHFQNTSSPSKYGRWGALESQLQKREDAPKWDALQTFLEQNPIWW